MDAPDYDALIEAVDQEVKDGIVSLVIVEGFRAFAQIELTSMMDLLIWLEVPRQVAQARRMKNKNVTADEFNNNIWTQHELYKDMIFWREVTIGLDLYKINSATTTEVVFQGALAKLQKHIQVKPLDMSTHQSVKKTRATYGQGQPGDGDQVCHVLDHASAAGSSSDGFAGARGLPYVDYRGT